MKIDSQMTKDIARTADDARRIADHGFDGTWIGETKHDPFLQAMEINRAAPSLQVGTAIAIAFARTPMTLAYSGYDLARYTDGQFVLGLGSQVKAHVERRFSMTWSKPAARMRELIVATRAIWHSWQTGDKLDFQGDFYTHTLMTPMFSPDSHVLGPPPIYLAGVGELMTQVAGEVADGFFVHPFTTPRYLDEVTLPALRAGRERAGKSFDDFVICGPSFVVAGTTEDEMADAVRGTKKQIAFYASTPAYRAVLDLHGWGDVQPELTAMSKQGKWDDMADLISDEMLTEFAVTGTPSEAGTALAKKLDGVQQRVTLYTTYDSDPGRWPPLVEAVHAGV